MTGLTIFPKRWFGDDLDTVCARVAALGCSGIDCALREQAWTRPAAGAAGIDAFVNTAHRHGLSVPLAVIAAGASELLADDDLLRACADAGIAHVRIGYCRDDGGGPAAVLEAARRDHIALAERAAAIGVRALYQVHHGTVIASPTAAWYAVRDADPAGIGVQLDAGNQQHEGFEAWGKAAALLGPHLASLGVKDCAWHQDDGHWWRSWVPVGQGVVDWQACMQAMPAGCLYDWQPFHDDEAALAAEIDRILTFLSGARS